MVAAFAEAAQTRKGEADEPAPLHGVALGENLCFARRRSAITACMMAERANLSLMALRSIERGSPHVSMCNYMAAIACLGFQEDSAAVTANGILGRGIQDAKR